jgi:hypothetical protein
LRPFEGANQNLQPFFFLLVGRFEPCGAQPL